MSSSRRWRRCSAGATNWAATRADIEWGVGVEPDDLDRFLAKDAPVYLEMGFTQFTLGFNGPDWPVEQGAQWLAWRDEVNARR